MPLGVFEGGRGAADTIFTFFVEQAGIYEFRTIWYEGGGGANIEWFVINPDGTRALVNGPNGPRAFRTQTSPPTGAVVTSATPGSGATGVAPDLPISLQITDATGATVDPATVTLRVGGNAVTPVVNKTGNVTTVTLAGSTNLAAAGSVQNAELSFGSGGATETRTWSFTVANYLALDCDLGTRPGTGTNPGFRVRTVQGEVARPGGDGNNDEAAEGQLRDNFGNPNVADTTLMTNNGFYNEDGVINYNQDAGFGTDIGNFTTDTGIPDVLPPGIPGTLGDNNNFSQEILTYLDLPAGLVRMGVNSDDGFKVTPATGADTNAPVLGIFSGGRGSADTIFFFVVEQAGVYPFRMIWYEGGGGANAEWFTVDSAGTKILVNGTAAGSIKAFRARD
jgi:hypothetical protein